MRRNLDRRLGQNEAAGNRLFGRILFAVFSIVLLIALYVGLRKMV